MHTQISPLVGDCTMSTVECGNKKEQGVSKATGSASSHDERARARELREKLRRIVAAEKAKRVQPKETRMAERLRLRDKRSPVMLELQMGGELAWKLMRMGFTTAATGLAWKFGKMAKKVGEDISSISDCLGELIKAIRKAVGDAIWKGVFLVAIYFMLRKYFSNAHAALLIVAPFVARKVGPAIWSLVSDVFQGEAPTVLQSGTGAGIVGKLFATGVVCSTVKEKNQRLFVSDLSQRLSRFDGTVNGFESFVKSLKDMVSVIVDYFAKLFGKEPVRLFHKNIDPLVEWYRVTDELMKFDAIGRTPTIDDIAPMIEAVSTGFRFREIFRGTPQARDIATQLSRLTAMLDVYRGILDEDNNDRPEPVMMCLTGNPGIGKTTLAKYICSAVLVEAGLIEHPTTQNCNKHIWQKGTSKYWEGYMGQKCLVMDDIFQAKPVVGQEGSEYLDVIKMVGPWSFPLDFATLESKGRYYFKSRFIYATTNLRGFTSQAGIVVQSPEAVARRIKYPYLITVKDGFKQAGKDELDMEAFTREQLSLSDQKGFARFPWHIWELRRWNVLSDTFGEPEDLWSVIQKMVVSIRSAEMYSKTNRAMLSSILTDVRQDDCVVPAKADVQGFGPLGSLIGRISNRRRRYNESVRALKDEVDGLGQLIDMKTGSAWNPFEAEAATLETIEELRRMRNERVSQWRDAIKEYQTYKVKLYMLASLVAVPATAALLLAAWKMTCATLGFVKQAKHRLKPRRQSNRPLTSTVRFRGPVSVGRSSKKTSVETTGVYVESVGKLFTDEKMQKVYANTYKVVIETSNGDDNVIGQFLMITGTLAVMPNHYFTEMQEMLDSGDINGEDTLHIMNSVHPSHFFGNKKQKVTVRDWLSLRRVNVPDSDVVFVDFSRFQIRSHAALHKESSSYFMTEKDCYLSNDRFHSLLVSETGDKKSCYLRHYKLPYVVQQHGLQAAGKSGVVEIARALKYIAATEKGECGAPLVMTDHSSFTGLIKGIHVAGGGSQGFSAVVTREMVDHAVKHLCVIVDASEEDLKSKGIDLQAGGEFPFRCLQEQGECSFLPIGMVQDPMVMNPVTKYFKTKHHAKSPLGVYTWEPAPLRPFRNPETDQTVFPMLNAVKPYSSPVQILSQPWLSIVAPIAMRKLTELTHRSPRFILTFDEAVLGLGSAYKFRAIPRGTSPGFPYRYESTNGKTKYFGDGANYDLNLDACEELRDRVQHVLNKARKGVRLSHIFVDFLKDELRAPEKVREGATRLISSAPLDYTIAWRMMFGAFSSAVMQNHTNSGMAPGICCYSDWTALRLFLGEVSVDKCFDGDFKRFDSSEQPMIHAYLLDYINGWYSDSEENQLARRVLWEDLVHSRHIGGDGTDMRYIYQWNKSLPSGHPFTTIVNSMYSLFLMVAAYKVCTSADLQSFWNEVRALTYGDDNIASVSSRIYGLYNQATVSAALEKEFAVLYTAGDKSGSLGTVKPMSELSFLKRGIRVSDMEDVMFGMHAGVTMAPLDLESFLYTCYWCKNKKFQAQIEKDVLDNALQELSLHAPSVWQKYSSTLLQMMSNISYAPMYGTSQPANRAGIMSKVDNWY